MRRSDLPGIVCAVILMSCASAAFGQVARVFVSVNGNDGNTCSNVATPCRTFSGGITQVDDGGEVIVLDTGSYGGTTITKGVTINVPPGVVAFSAQPFTVNAPGKNVTMRGLTLKALTSGTGLSLNDVGTLTIENCVFNGWSFGISAFGPGKLVVRNSVFKNMTAVGLVLQPGTGSVVAMISGSQFEGSGSAGLLVLENATAWVRDSTFTENVYGAQAWSFDAGAPSELNVRNCLFTRAQYGIQAYAQNGGAALARVSGSVIMGNSAGGLVQTIDGVLESYGDNDVRGNSPDTFGTITPIGSTRK